LKEHQLANLGGPVLAWQDRPSADELEKHRVSLEGTRSSSPNSKTINKER
jgi:hypothetical protein